MWLFTQCQRQGWEATPKPHALLWSLGCGTPFAVQLRVSEKHFFCYHHSGGSKIHVRWKRLRPASKSTARARGLTDVAGLGRIWFPAQITIPFWHLSKTALCCGQKEHLSLIPSQTFRSRALLMVWWRLWMSHFAAELCRTFNMQHVWLYCLWALSPVKDTGRQHFFPHASERRRKTAS